jgi:1,4-dihydroxy-2-naphthoate octaprenyltransferase
MVKFSTLALVVWLLVGAIAAGQRHEYGNLPMSCSGLADITVTIIAGGLNYVGVDPKISCHAPQPSR